MFLAVGNQRDELIRFEALGLSPPRLFNAHEADDRQNNEIVPAPEQGQRAKFNSVTTNVQVEREADRQNRQNEKHAIKSEEGPFDETPVAIAALRGHLEFVSLRLQQPDDDRLQNLRRRDQLTDVGHNWHHAPAREPAHGDGMQDKEGKKTEGHAVSIGL